MVQFFIAFRHYLEAEINYGPVLLFHRVVSQDHAQKIQVNSANIEGVKEIFMIFAIMEILVSR